MPYSPLTFVAIILTLIKRGRLRICYSMTSSPQRSAHLEVPGSVDARYSCPRLGLMHGRARTTDGLRRDFAAVFTLGALRQIAPLLRHLKQMHPFIRVGDKLRDARTLARVTPILFRAGHEPPPKSEIGNKQEPIWFQRREIA